MKEEIKHNLSGPLWNMYFGVYEEDTDVAHIGRSKRDGAKVGSGRYPLGSGKEPYQHTNSDTRVTGEEESKFWKSLAKQIIQDQENLTTPKGVKLEVPNNQNVMYRSITHPRVGKMKEKAKEKIKNVLPQDTANLYGDMLDSKNGITKLKYQIDGDVKATSIDMVRYDKTKKIKDKTGSMLDGDMQLLKSLDKNGFHINYMEPDDNLNIKRIQALADGGNEFVDIKIMNKKDFMKDYGPNMKTSLLLGPIGSGISSVNKLNKYYKS